MRAQPDGSDGGTGGVTRAMRRRFAQAADRRQRRELGLILLEGERVVALAVDLGCELESVVVAADRADLVRAHPGAIVAEPRVLRQLGSTATAPPIVALCRAPRAPDRPELARGVVALDGVQDPGNVGAIVRVAQAYGLGGVVLGAGCADPGSPKVVRGSMGTVLALPVLQVEALAEWLEARAAEGTRVVLADPAGGRPWEQIALAPQQGVCLVMGGEARGASPRVRELAGIDRVSLPATGAAGSLGVAAAAAILIHLLAGTRDAVSSR